jgi:hypothetical protein
LASWIETGKLSSLSRSPIFQHNVDLLRECVSYRGCDADTDQYLTIFHLRDAGNVLDRSHEVDLVRRMQDGGFHGGLLPEQIRCYRSAVGRSRGWMYLGID